MSDKVTVNRTTLNNVKKQAVVLVMKITEQMVVPGSVTVEDMGKAIENLGKAIQVLEQEEEMVWGTSEQTGG